MVNYKDLGLVNTREMFARAIKGGYAIPAFNFNNMEQMQAIIKAAVETKSPVILQVSKGARQYANATLLRYMAQGAVEYAKELGCKHPEIVLHLDHGDTFETCKSCIDSGFSSVMIDGSHLPYEENVALTKKVVDYAHQFDVTVEGELGVLAGVEDEVSAEHHTYTNPEEVIDFATRTGCDSLAISIGTSHGAYKFKPEQCHVDPATGRLVPPPLEFAVLDAVMEKLPGFPIVLHGSSSVPQEEVDTINKFGGKLEAAIGIPEDQLRKAAKSAVCKINIDSDSRLAMTAAVRKVFAEKPLNSTRVNTWARLVTTWRNFTSTKSSTCLVRKTNWLNWTDRVNLIIKRSAFQCTPLFTFRHGLNRASRCSFDFRGFPYNPCLAHIKSGSVYNSITSDSRAPIFNSSPKAIVLPLRMSLPCLASFSISL